VPFFSSTERVSEASFMRKPVSFMVREARRLAAQQRWRPLQQSRWAELRGLSGHCPERAEKRQRKVVSAVWRAQGGVPEPS
jgi:hypothetical protein